MAWTLPRVSCELPTIPQLGGFDDHRPTSTTFFSLRAFAPHPAPLPRERGSFYGLSLWERPTRESAASEGRRCHLFSEWALVAIDAREGLDLKYFRRKLSRRRPINRRLDRRRFPPARHHSAPIWRRRCRRFHAMP